MYTSLNVKPEEEDTDDFLENKESIVLCRIGYANLLGKRCQYDGVETIRTCKTMLNEIIATGIIVNKKYNDLIVSATMTNYEDVKLFEQWVKEYSDSEEKPDHIICVSADKSYSKGLANAIKEILSAKKKECFYYSYEDESLYDLADNVVELDDIWTIPDIESKEIESTEDINSEKENVASEIISNTEKTVVDEIDDESNDEEKTNVDLTETEEYVESKEDIITDNRILEEELIDEKNQHSV